MPTMDDFRPATETGLTGFDHLTELAERLVKHRATKDGLKVMLSDVQAKLDAIEAEMCETMTRGEYGKFTVRGHTFYMRTTTQVSAPVDRRDDLIEWLDENGHSEMAKRTVHSQTLGAFVRELVDESGSLPDDLGALVTLFQKPSISIRKG